MPQYEPVQNIEMIPSPSKSTLLHPPRYEVVDGNDTPSDTNLIPNQQPLPRDAPSTSSPLTYQRAHGSIRWPRIGLSGLLVLIVGTMLILASCGILIFLWSGTSAAKDRNQSVFWQIIVVRGWASRVVTICSAAIRTSMGLHIGLIAAAAAAIILETTGVLLVDAPALSIERATGASPFNILPAALRRCVAGRGSGLLHLLILTLTIFLGLLSTFTSTILLSDFETVQVQGPVKTRNLAIDTNKTGQFWKTTSYWRYSPSAQWRFAEEKIDDIDNSPGETYNTFRAMLPFSDTESRTSLEYYSGPAVVANFRTKCVPPMMQNVSFQREDGKLYMSFNEVIVSSGPMSKREDSSDNVRVLLIDCSSSQTTWPISLYTNPNPKPGSTLMFSTPGPGGKSFITKSVFHSVFLINSTFLRNKNHTESWDTILTNATGIKIEHGDVWTKISDRDGLELVNATTCFVNVAAPNTHHVNMTGHAIKSEPDGDWRHPKNDTTIRHQFGVGLRQWDFSNRGILELSIGSPLNVDKTEKDSDFPAPNLLLNGSLKDSASSLEGCWALSDDLNSLYCFEDWSAHATHAAVFQEIIQETQEPALAVQALMTRLYQMAYYDWLQSYDIEYAVGTIHAINALIPARWNGLGIVLGLVCLHLVLLLVTILLFATRTKSSMLGNAWQAVSQMVSPQTREIVESADRMRDEEVNQWIRATGRAEVYNVSISGPSERIEINHCGRG
ncbi:hypothetical protein CDV36_001350 [Fusarium kuroshium]|uniref:Uncharacterized protein n=1 Tax=Fusarium kuroshium TaxID=2010991 RepID=A0A3M2SN47_9HYPO|nr:hypothetical protein CDV36_001350 [Fusarium kuroshium]